MILYNFFVYAFVQVHQDFGFCELVLSYKYVLYLLYTDKYQNEYCLLYLLSVDLTHWRCPSVRLVTHLSVCHQHVLIGHWPDCPAAQWCWQP